MFRNQDIFAQHVVYFKIALEADHELITIDIQEKKFSLNCLYFRIGKIFQSINLLRTKNLIEGSTTLY